MAPLTITQRIARARIYTRDTSTTTPGLTDAQYTNLVNDASSLYRALYPDDFIESVSVTPTVGVSSFTVTSGSSNGIRNVTSVIWGDLSSGATSMEKISFSRWLSIFNSYPAGGPPKYATTRASGQHTNVTVYVVPPVPPIANKYTAYFTPEVAAMVSGTDTDGLDENASLTTALMAAVAACPLLGRDDAFTQALAAKLPQQIQEHLRTATRDKGPGATADTEVA